LIDLGLAPGFRCDELEPRSFSSTVERRMSGRAQGPRRAALAFIFITIVLDMLALGMIIPVLPKVIEDFMGGDTAGAAKMYGLFSTVWALMQFFAMPVMGALSDRFGRRR